MSLKITTNTRIDTRKVAVEVNELVTNKLDYQIMKNINENEHAVIIKSVCECGSTKFNTTVKDKPFCFLCGKDARDHKAMNEAQNQPSCLGVVIASAS
jgi:hypothetical protein